jgi:hypothetical protein
VNALEAERIAHRAQLVHEALDGPERPVVRLVGLAAAELIVEHDPALVGQLRERQQVVMWRPRPAVQAQERRGLAVAI